MELSFAIGILALASLAPAAALALWRIRQANGDAAKPDATAAYWLAVALGTLGPAAAAGIYVGAAWRTGLAPTLWATVAACMALFAVLGASDRDIRRLGVLLFPYLMLLGTVAAVWGGAVGGVVSEAAPPAWVTVHIAAALLTYAFLTLAAIAGVAVMLQEHSLKAKRRPPLGNGLLPSLADAEVLQVRLLLATEVVLLVGLLSGMATNYLETGRLLPFDHKTLFSLAAFIVIGGLLLAHRQTGVRGRRAARIVLAGYLLVTLGFPGVKFVTDVIL